MHSSQGTRHSLQPRAEAFEIFMQYTHLQGSLDDMIALEIRWMSPMSFPEHRTLITIKKFKKIKKNNVFFDFLKSKKIKKSKKKLGKKIKKSKQQIKTKIKKKQKKQKKHNKTQTMC